MEMEFSSKVEGSKEIVYEWDWEECTKEDDEGLYDVLDHNHMGKLEDTRQRLNEDSKWLHKNNQDGHFDLVLVRDVHDYYEGIINRTHAYIEDGKLPKYFSNGIEVPKRFHKEFDRWKRC
jgi:hypothetical protein